MLTTAIPAAAPSSKRPFRRGFDWADLGVRVVSAAITRSSVRCAPEFGRIAAIAIQGDARDSDPTDSEATDRSASRRSKCGDGHSSGRTEEDPAASLAPSCRGRRRWKINPHCPHPAAHRQRSNSRRQSNPAGHRRRRRHRWRSQRRSGSSLRRLPRAAPAFAKVPAFSRRLRRRAWDNGDPDQYRRSSAHRWRGLFRKRMLRSRSSPSRPRRRATRDRDGACFWSARP